jgi:SAM-dependent methyltransferase
VSGRDHEEELQRFDAGPRSEPGAIIGPAAKEWQARYDEGTPPWDMGEPSPPLVHFLDRGELPEGRMVLIPGSGSGHELVLLARAGYRPVGLDFAPSAVRLSRARLEREGLSGHVVMGDLFDPELAIEPGSIDWAFEQTCFCAIPPARRDDYGRALARAVRPGGEVWALSVRTDNTEHPPYDSTPEDFEAALAPHGFEAIEKRPLDLESAERRRGRETLVRMRRVKSGA